MRIALFTLESLASAAPVRRFIADHAADLAFVGLSAPYRASAGGQFGQIAKHLRHSGLRFVPYLLANFGLPELMVKLRPRLRETRPESTPTQTLCKRLGIPTITIGDLNDGMAAAEIRRRGVDLILSYHFDQIFKNATLESARLGGINVHPALLPHHRGPVPTLYAAMETPPLYGVTIHRLIERIDAGEILFQTAMEPVAGLSALGMATKLHEAALPGLTQVLAALETGDAKGFTPEILPYCHFPERRTLAEASRRRIAVTNWLDFRHALAV